MDTMTQEDESVCRKAGNLYPYKLTAQIDAAFEAEVTALAQEAQSIQASHKELAYRYLIFARRFHGTWEEAKRLGYDAYKKKLVAEGKYRAR